MDYFFINTDADSFIGQHNLSTWFKKKLAFTGGEYHFGQQLARLKPRDFCLMYENRRGVVGIGRVLEEWNGEPYDHPLYYVGEDGVGRDGIDQDGSEYRIKVDWFCDLRSNQIDIMKRLGYAPRGAVSRIVKYRHQLEKMVTDYIASSPKNPPKKRTGGQAPDKDLIIRIEQAAISATSAFFDKAGYKVVSVEKDNRGWDLDATKNGERLLVEVKGHIGNVIQFELTPNEYTQLQANSSNYRLCVVRNALEEPEVEVYVPSQKKGTWSLVRHNGKGRIRLAERVAAVASEAE
ncbi:MAG: DUF3883 domain-containing protein [Bacteroidales bacterium]|nr:DUF3883 domain-containing protein [Bacteroidales bacterium]